MKGKITINMQLGRLLGYINSARRRLAALTPDDLQFPLLNTAKDNTSDKYYYYIVDLGRGPIQSTEYVQTKSGGTRLKRLAFLNTNGVWVFTTQVKGFAGHQLTNKINRKLQEAIPTIVKETYFDGSPLSVRTLRAIIKKMKVLSVTIARDATVKETKYNRYRETLYKIQVKGLADSFTTDSRGKVAK